MAQHISLFGFFHGKARKRLRIEAQRAEEAEWFGWKYEEDTQLVFGGTQQSEEHQGITQFGIRQTPLFVGLGTARRRMRRGRESQSPESVVVPDTAQLQVLSAQYSLPPQPPPSGVASATASPMIPAFCAAASLTVRVITPPRSCCKPLGFCSRSHHWPGGSCSSVVCSCSHPVSSVVAKPHLVPLSSVPALAS